MATARKFNIGRCLLGALFLWVSVLAFQNPGSDLIGLVLFFSLSAIIKGGLELVERKKMVAVEGRHANQMVVIGIIDLLVGVFFLFHIALGVMISPFIFAIWFISDSVFSLMSLGLMKQRGGRYWFSLVAGVIGIILGVMLFFNPIVSAITLAFLIAFYFLLTGINYLINAF
ncbi:DUF308 domain-containing protein [uncultured Vagococcus sp.]|uniref:HdeD family acid-resistance protein n=1 Tax=uncultured Vagococcus sp. TaxID=189676 RepID=UPI0028D26891|nr:DUF308 domain-containing protein [uncultured Vagococcus sp.]